MEQLNSAWPVMWQLQDVYIWASRFGQERICWSGDRDRIRSQVNCQIMAGDLERDDEETKA